MSRNLWQVMGISERDVERAAAASQCGTPSAECGVKKVSGCGSMGVRESGDSTSSFIPPHPHTPAPSSSPAPPHAHTPAPPRRPTVKTIRDKRLRLPRIPRERAQKWLREHSAGKSQHQIAREEGVKQPSVCRAIGRCRKYIAQTGAALPDVDPAGQLHLANVTEALELEALRREAEEMTRRVETPYPGRTTTIERDGKVEKKTVMHQDPPRVAWIRERRMLTKDLWKARRAAAAEVEECGSAGVRGTQDSSTPTPPLSPSPTPASRPSFALSPPLATAEAYDEETIKDWAAIDGAKRSCGRKCPHDHVASLPQRAAYWRYQALGVRQGLSQKARTIFVQHLLALDGLAPIAAAMAEAESAGVREHGGEGVREHGGEGDSCSPPLPLSPSPTPSPPHSATPTLTSAPPHAHTPAPLSPRDYLTRLLILDYDSDPERQEQVLAHFDVARGIFDWEQPADDLRWVAEEASEYGGEGVWESGGQVSECGSMGVRESGESTSSPIPPHPHTPTPLPAPAVIPAATRQFWIDTPGRLGVVIGRLNDTRIVGHTLADVPNDQSSVVIYEAVEEVIKEECGMRNADDDDCGLRIADCGLRNGMTNEIPNPKSEIPNAAAAANPQSAICNPQSPLTPARRDELYAAVGREGVVVLGLDGKTYMGARLSECGLVQRGILFLRELCHSTPPWGESPWRNHQPRPRKGSGERVQGRGFRGEGSGFRKDELGG